jgi:hypothetical protein
MPWLPIITVTPALLAKSANFGKDLDDFSLETVKISTTTRRRAGSAFRKQEMESRNPKRREWPRLSRGCKGEPVTERRRQRGGIRLPMTGSVWTAWNMPPNWLAGNGCSILAVRKMPGFDPAALLSGPNARISAGGAGVIKCGLSACAGVDYCWTLIVVRR